MPSKRLLISVDLDTPLTPAQATADVMGWLESHWPQTMINTCYVNLYDSDSDGPDVTVFTVLDSAGRTARTLIGDEDTAHRIAEMMGGLIVELPVLADYRSTTPGDQ